jgi:hypothetical protein
VNVTLSPVEDTIEIGMSLYEVVPLEPVSRGMHLSGGDELGTMVGVALLGTLLGYEVGSLGKPKIQQDLLYPIPARAYYSVVLAGSIRVVCPSFRFASCCVCCLLHEVATDANR